MRSLFLLAVVLTFAFLALPGTAPAQSVSTLYTFPPAPDSGDPAGPPIVGTDGNIYGTLAGGGADEIGAIYQVTPAGKVTSIYSFVATGGAPNGDTPEQIIQASNGNFYGICALGGSKMHGNIFMLTPPAVGSTTFGFKLIYNFTGFSDGALPSSILDGGDGYLYGITSESGASNSGAVFKLKIGTSLVTKSPVLTSFTGSYGIDPGPLFKASDGNFYGMTLAGVTSKFGAIYKMTPAGVVTLVHSFLGAAKKDGSTPYGVGAFIQGPNDPGNIPVLYALTATGGAYNGGAIIKLSLPTGTESVVYSFGGNTLPNPPVYPTGSLVLADDGNLYGATSATKSGSSGIIPDGVIFSLSPDYALSVVATNPVVNAVTSNIQSGLIEAPDGDLYGVAAMPYVPPTNLDPHKVTSAIFKLDRGTSKLTSAEGVTTTLGDPFAFQVTATNQATHFSAHGLPTGLSISSTGLITGTPTKVGEASASIYAANAKGTSMTPFAITVLPRPVPAISSPLTAFGILKKAFTYTLTTSYTNATLDAPVTFQVSSLPAGLIFNSGSNTITGTPTKAGSFSPVLTVTNKAGTITANLTLTIFNSPPALGAQYVILHNFNDGSVPDDGAYPSIGGIIQDANGLLYGTTGLGGGTGSQGAFYSLTTTGSDPTVLGSFSTASGNDGYSPTGVIQGADGNFYGVCTSGGFASHGTVFKIDSLGNITTLHNFGDGSVAKDGSFPTTGLVQGQDGNFYGLTGGGGTASHGTVFKINPSGAYAIMHNFGDGSANPDGSDPEGSLIVGTDGNFYGLTNAGGSAGLGTIFQMTPAGTVKVLHSFGDGFTTNDGIFPTGGSLVQATDGNFYGTTYYGGDPSASKGAVFQMTPAGVTKTIYSFPNPASSTSGASPQTGLIEGFDGNLYGTTSVGGNATANGGTLFRLTFKGAFLLLHQFTYVAGQSKDGSVPQAPLLQGPDGNFYGTTTNGGNGGGTVFTIIANQIPTFAPVVSGPLTVAWAEHGAGSFRLNAQGASSWSATGLPVGLTIDSATGVVKGSPTTAKIYNATISATNAIGTTVTPVVFNIVTYPAITNTVIPPAQKVGTTFTYQMTVTGLPNLYIASGLPPGVSINPFTGLISGKLTTAGTYTLHLSAQNAAGTATYLTVPFSVTN